MKDVSTGSDKTKMRKKKQIQTMQNKTCGQVEKPGERYSRKIRTKLCARNVQPN